MTLHLLNHISVINWNRLEFTFFPIQTGVIRVYLPENKMIEVKTKLGKPTEFLKLSDVLKFYED